MEFLVLFAVLTLVAGYLRTRPVRRKPRSEVEDWLDLHTYAPRDMLPAVESFLEAAVEAGYEEVRVVHGKGKGVQRQRVRALLANHPLVISFGDAPGHRGGWGAQVVRLRLYRQAAGIGMPDDAT